MRDTEPTKLITIVEDDPDVAKIIEIGTRQTAQGKSRQWRHGERGGEGFPADAGSTRVAGGGPHRAEHRKVASQRGGAVQLGGDMTGCRDQRKVGSPFQHRQLAGRRHRRRPL